MTDLPVSVLVQTHIHTDSHLHNIQEHSSSFYGFDDSPKAVSYTHLTLPTIYSV